MTEVIDGTTGELIPYEAPAPVTLFGSNNPAEVVEAATLVAESLADVIRQQHLYKTIGQKNHVLVEGWTLLGSMTGVFPVVEWTRPVENGWEARVEARTRAGELVGAAEAMCTRDEKTWANRDDYAIRSMAQTRATSKALRGPLGFIVQLAGYNATPADEMPSEEKVAAPKTTDNEPAPQNWKAKMFARAGELQEAGVPAPDGAETWEGWIKVVSKARFEVDSRANLTKGQVSWFIEQMKDGAPPF